MSLTRFRPLLPPVAVACCYSLLFGLPQVRELNRTRHELQTRTSAVEDMMRQLNETAEARLSSAEPEQFVAFPPQQNHTGSTPQPLSFAQAFSSLLTIFESHGIDCSTSRPEGEQARGKPIVQRLSLTGDFKNMLSALELIASQVPSVATQELSLNRPSPLDRCRWEVVLRFAEER